MNPENIKKWKSPLLTPLDFSKHLKNCFHTVCYLSMLFWVTLIGKKISILLSAFSLKNHFKRKRNINAGQSSQSSFFWDYPKTTEFQSGCYFWIYVVNPSVLWTETQKWHDLVGVAQLAEDLGAEEPRLLAVFQEHWIWSLICRLEIKGREGKRWEMLRTVFGILVFWFYKWKQSGIF